LQFEDGLAPSPATPLDEGRRQFLLNAISSLTAEVTEKIRVRAHHIHAWLISGLQSIMEALMSDATDECRRIEAMDELLEFIEDIDIARDFMTIGGLRPLLKGLPASVCVCVSLVAGPSHAP
jgi:hypothetical protein